MAAETSKKSLVKEVGKNALLGGALLTGLSFALSIFVALPAAIAGPLGWGIVGGAVFGAINWAASL